MKLLGHIAFLLLLGGICCQNNRNAKAGGKSTKKSGGTQGVDVSQSAPVVDLTPGSTRSNEGTVGTRGTGGTGGTGGAGSSRGTGGAGDSGSTRGTGGNGSAGDSGSTRGSGGAGGTGGTGSAGGSGGSGSTRGTGGAGGTGGTGSTGGTGGAGSSRGTGGAGDSGSTRGTGGNGSAGDSGSTRGSGGAGGTGGTGSTGGSGGSGSTRGTGGAGGSGNTRGTGVTGGNGGAGGSGSTRGTGGAGDSVSTRGSGGAGDSGSTRGSGGAGGSGSTRGTGGAGGTGGTGSTGGSVGSGSTRGTGGAGGTGGTGSTGGSVGSGSTRGTGGAGGTGGTGGAGGIGNTRGTGGTGGAGGSGSTRGIGGAGGTGGAGGSGSTRGAGGTGGTGNTRSSGGTAEAGREGAAGARAAVQQTDDMRLHFLKNSQVTCNDGTAAGFYLKEFRGSRRWLLFLEGGWCCYSKETCDSRYQNIPRLMSSSGWPQTKRGTGILSSQVEVNPHWYNANIVFIPYCSSDVWSGTGPAPTNPPRARQGREKERERNVNNATEYTFMGSLIIREVIKDLIPKGIKQAKVVMLSGTSAGGTGVLLNIERVASQLEQLGAEAQVRGLVDSGWFIESKQQRSPNCPETVSCSPEDAIKIGLRLWNGVVPDRCRQLHKRGEEWQCFFGHKLFSTLTSPLFVVQWLFDEEQLRVENIYVGGQSLSEEQWQYIQNLGRELKNSLRDVTAVFAPSCLSHTVLTKSNWMTFQVKGTSLPRALHCWDRSLEATRNNRTPAKGCPFHLVDTCQWPQCNPTCPALVDQATQQKLTLLQMLVAMGLDPQRLGLDHQGDEDEDSLVSIVSNGG